jgi:hypothetical protein
MPSLKTILWVLFWIFVVWFIVTNPAGAATAAHGIGHLFTRLATGISAFLSSFHG